jgi:hypothetical protein
MYERRLVRVFCRCAARNKRRRAQSLSFLPSGFDDSFVAHHPDPDMVDDVRGLRVGWMFFQRSSQSISDHLSQPKTQ